jgi:hypothetical protein
MKTALLILLAEDRKSGQPITDVLPLDQAKAQYKKLCEGGVSPDPRFPVVALWVGELKSRRLKGTLSVPAVVDSAAVDLTDTGEGLVSLSGEGSGDSEPDLLAAEGGGEESAAAPAPGAMSPRGKHRR